jgi:hypothetical protein
MDEEDNQENYDMNNLIYMNKDNNLPKRVIYIQDVDENENFNDLEFINKYVNVDNNNKNNNNHKNNINKTNELQNSLQFNKKQTNQIEQQIKLEKLEKNFIQEQEIDELNYEESDKYEIEKKESLRHCENLYKSMINLRHDSSDDEDSLEENSEDIMIVKEDEILVKKSENVDITSPKSSKKNLKNKSKSKLNKTIEKTISKKKAKKTKNNSNKSLKKVSNIKVKPKHRLGQRNTIRKENNKNLKSKKIKKLKVSNNNTNVDTSTVLIPKKKKVSRLKEEIKKIKDKKYKFHKNLDSLAQKDLKDFSWIDFSNFNLMNAKISMSGKIVYRYTIDQFELEGEWSFGEEKHKFAYLFSKHSKTILFPIDTNEISYKNKGAGTKEEKLEKTDNNTGEFANHSNNDNNDCNLINEIIDNNNQNQNITQINKNDNENETNWTNLAKKVNETFENIEPEKIKCEDDNNKNKFPKIFNLTINSSNIHEIILIPHKHIFNTVLKYLSGEYHGYFLYFGKTIEDKFILDMNLIEYIINENIEKESTNENVINTEENKQNNINDDIKDIITSEIEFYASGINILGEFELIGNVNFYNSKGKFIFLYYIFLHIIKNYY